MTTLGNNLQTLSLQNSLNYKIIFCYKNQIYRTNNECLKLVGMRPSYKNELVKRFSRPLNELFLVKTNLFY